MAGFFTKKQKAQMRERQRRKKNGGVVPVKKNSVARPPPDDENDDKHVKRTSDKEGVKRKQPVNERIEIVKQEKEDEETVNHPPSQSNVVKDPSVILVPANLSGADARKFRKDARRKAREQGLDDSKLTFVVQGESAAAPTTSEANDNTGTTTAATSSKTNNNNKNNKRAFPCIKDLVEQERQAKRRRLQAEKMQQEASTLTEEYKARYVALDCEMVGIGSQGRTSALARASLVDWYGKVLLDTFVQVPTRVTDFRTHVSGVTPQHLKHDNAMDLSECRDKVAAILKHKILVGHAVHNDLAALMLQHPKEDRRDTATYRPFQRCHSKAGKTKWRPRKLRDLVKENLQLEIQTAGNAHDSVQDAWATMQLFQTVRSSWEEELVADPKHKRQQQHLEQQQQQQPKKKKQRTTSTNK